MFGIWALVPFVVHADTAAPATTKPAPTVVIRDHLRDIRHLRIAESPLDGRAGSIALLR